MTFPAGKNDDQVDALGLIGQVLDKMIMGSRKEASHNQPKVLSTIPGECTVSLTELFEANERKYSKNNLRIN
jgi:hypothetical protein